MPLRHFTLASYLLISAIGFSQTQPNLAKLRDQRRELARQYLLAAGIAAPERLDADHISALRSVLRNWIDSSAGNGQPAVTDARYAGSGSGQSAPASQQANVQVQKDVIPIRTFYPGKGARFARLLQFKAEGVEQARTIQFGSPPMPVMNPDHVLYKFNLIGDFSQLYLTSADFASIYTAHATANENDAPTNEDDEYQSAGRAVAKTYQLPISPLDNGPCKKPEGAGEDWNFVDCLRRADRKGIVDRVFAGLTATLSYSQNPQILQNANVPKGAQNFFSGEVLYDPTKYLFPTGTDWKAAVSALNFQKVDSSYPGKPEKAVDRNNALFKELGKALFKECDVPYTPDSKPSEIRNSECVLKLAGRRGTIEVLAAMIPIFDYKVQTNFDFYKNGGSQFVPNPFPENHLWDFTFTTDLRKIISTVQSRADAESALKVYFDQARVKPKEVGACELPKLPTALMGAFYSYTIDKDSQTEREWELVGCQKTSAGQGSYKGKVCLLNGLTLTKSGLLSGYPDQPEITLKFKVTSTSGGGAGPDCPTVTLKVRSPVLEAKSKLLLDYLELAVSPDIVLDEKWFAEFKQVVEDTLFESVEQAQLLTHRE